MLKHLIDSKWDMLLVFIVSLSFATIALHGFYIADSLRNGPIPAIICAIVTVILFAFGTSRRTRRIGVPVVAAVLVLSWIVAGALTPSGDIFTDNQTNYLIFVMCATLVPTGCFLASRSRLGTALLFIFGIFAIGVLQLLYAHSEVLWLVLFVLGSLTLLIYKNYQLALKTASTVRRASLAPGFLAGLGVVGAAVVAALAIWFGIIAPLNPSALQIKLVTEYRSLETKQVIGTSQQYQMPNISMTSNNLNNGSRTTGDIKEGSDGTRWPAKGKKNNQENNKKNTFLGIDLDSLQQTFDFQSNPSARPMMLAIIAIVIALIVLAFVLRRLRRRWRLARFKKLGSEEEYRKTFLFLMSRLGRLGFALPNGVTLLEFADSTKQSMHAYEEVSTVPFARLAKTYAVLEYGAGTIADDDIAALETFYQGFWKAARKQLGNFKYFFRSFRL